MWLLALWMIQTSTVTWWTLKAWEMARPTRSWTLTKVSVSPVYHTDSFYPALVISKCCKQNVLDIDSYWHQWQSVRFSSLISLVSSESLNLDSSLIMSSSDLPLLSRWPRPLESCCLTSLKGPISSPNELMFVQLIFRFQVWGKRCFYFITLVNDSAATLELTWVFLYENYDMNDAF